MQYYATIKVWLLKGIHDILLNEKNTTEYLVPQIFMYSIHTYIYLYKYISYWDE